MIKAHKNYNNACLNLEMSYIDGFSSYLHINLSLTTKREIPMQLIFMRSTTGPVYNLLVSLLRKSVGVS